MDNKTTVYPTENSEGMLLIDKIAIEVMNNTAVEVQETVPATFWDWVKQMLIVFAHMTFLKVNYTTIEGTKEVIAKRSYELAAAMIEERKKHINQ